MKSKGRIAGGDSAACYRDEAPAAVLGILHIHEQRLAAIEQAVADACRLLRRQHQAEKDWYSTSELAEAMGVSVYTVTQRWCNQGRIACEKDGDTGKWRIRGREFRRLVRGGPLKPKRG